MSKELLKSWAKKDFKIEWFSGTGAGGQHRNKTQNCCRITHIETGLTETGQNHRERSRNRKEAFERLAKKVVSNWKEQTKSEKVINDEIVRTYNVPDNRVKDHSSNTQVLYKNLDNELDMLITERILSKTNEYSSKTTSKK